MNKKTKLWMISLILITAVVTAILYLIYTHEATYTFEAYVKEVYHDHSSALLIPVNSDHLRYTNVIANNITNIREGQIITLTIKTEYREVYPPVVEVIRYETARR